MNLYTMKEMFNDMIELVKYNRMYKKGKNNIDIEMAFDDKFTHKRCELASRMNEINWVTDKTIRYGGELGQLSRCSDRLSMVIYKYYKLHRKTKRGDIISIGDGLERRFYPAYIMEDF